ncbi:homoprotocatechuate degradation operon regulator HpaR (plasmid) [Rhizobium sp. ACO-34A]|nr:homoprotocatechuate degradation operon regulator HpaR [Rhizobium sp. ACO-34A]ATN36863.1 homoprotocatechuate degradation operon regulator HpaR [Rhizobium sp. ACO-34A]
MTDRANLRDTQTSLPTALLRAREAMASRFRPIFALYDITDAQWRVLRVLDEAEMLTASDVARRAMIQGPSLTRIIRTLNERGLICIQKNGADGRAVLLTIDKAGRSLIREIVPQTSGLYRHVEESFGAARMSTLIGLLNELAELPLDES